MPYYSHHGAPPAPLPFRIHLSDGRSRTDPATFTPEDLADAGYVEAPPQPQHDPATHRLEWTGDDWQAIALTADELADRLARRQDTARRTTHDLLARAYDSILAPYPAGERLSWPAKEDAARAHLAGTAAPHQTALLAAEADEASETVDAIAAVILARADAWRQTAGHLSGLRRRALAAIDAAPDTAAVDAAVDALRAGIEAAGLAR